MTSQSKSFLLVLVLILLASYGAIKLAENFKVDRIPSVQSAPEKKGVVSTNGWLSYIDNAYPLAFRYPANWKVANIDTEPGYYVVAIMPKGKTTEMRVYINDQDYYALRGLDSSPVRIGGQPAMSYGPMLASAKVGRYYYTFDAGLDTSLVPEFQTILSTVEFR